MNKAIITLFLLMCMSSCQMLLGIKKPKVYSDDKISKFHNKHIGESPMHKLNVDLFLLQYDSLKKQSINDFNDIAQPFQILVYDKNLDLQTHLVNCNIGGLPLKWNRTGSFDNYPIQANGLLQPKYKVDFNNIVNYIIPTISQEEVKDITNNYEYIYVVIYSRFVYSISKSYFKHLNEHKSKYADKMIKYIYVYAEELFIGM